MPVAPDRSSSGRTFIWITACFLFLCVLGGGACLVEYIMLPESEVPYWIPYLGITLVCLPWAFWLLTFLYRILSRCWGCRLGFNDDVVNVGGRDHGLGGGGGGAISRGISNNSNHANNNNELDRNLSAASHESQMPFAKSMA